MGNFRRLSGWPATFLTPWLTDIRVKILWLLLGLTILGPALRADDDATEGRVTGRVFDPGSGQPVELVAVKLRPVAGSTAVRAAVTDAKGHFVVEHVPFGRYQAMYATVGAEPQLTPAFTVDAAHRRCDLGRLALAVGPVRMAKFEVTAQREMMANTIDRKVYVVGKDLQSATGVASDLLQHIPSVDVDIEGNVSLRGNDSVLILINGKPSALMNAANRATSLDMMPADAIEKIEVITNPSAKYKPDGTAGIINITLKRQPDSGQAGSIRANVGNDGRSNLAVNLHRQLGRLHLFGGLNVRQDARLRYTHENRSHFDSTANAVVGTEQTLVENMRPLTRLAQLGSEYQLSDATKVGATADYNYRTFFRTSTTGNLSRTAGLAVGDYDRDRADDEWQKTLSLGATVQHTFDREGQELDVEVKHERHQELEANHYVNVYRLPAAPSTQDYTSINPTDTTATLSADYTQPMDGGAKLDAGYALELGKTDMDYRGGYVDPVTAAATNDPTRTNRFIYRDHLHAIYGTYRRSFGSFGVLAGLRLENTAIVTNQATVQQVDKTDYLRLYPSLHLSYNLTEADQLQLNFSHRIHRPDSEDLNPFPQYQDPYNLREGNPRLLPEDTNSLEAGIQHKEGDTTYLATHYYRQTYHAFTMITRYIDSVTLLTTYENLATNRSGGLELAANGDLGHQISVNGSANAFYSEIDASNLGFDTPKSAITWSTKLNASWHATKDDLVQFNTSYFGKRLTPQGYRRPMFIANIGLRHELSDRKTAFVLTISDVLNSLEERTVIDTPNLHDEITRRRSSRIIYVGVIYNFGKPAKKKKDDSIQFDDKL